MNNENQNINNIKEDSLVVDGDLFSRMMETSVALFEEIMERSQQGEDVTDAEAEWANTFVEYSHALELVEVKNNESNE